METKGKLQPIAGWIYYVTWYRYVCVFTLKQITENHNQRSSQVYICYLDASNEFDRIKKLIKYNIDVILIRLLIFWYCQQTFCVRWGD